MGDKYILFKKKDNGSEIYVPDITDEENEQRIRKYEQDIERIWGYTLKLTRKTPEQLAEEKSSTKGLL